MPQKYPEVQGGGSLILAWQIKNKNVLVIGGGEVSTTTISSSTTADSYGR
jgi:precorrin-2 dehydrogenase / sirohydrochlorin ferrochelatase